jgi:hypothetical protein
MTRSLLPFLISAVLAAPAAFADDLLPTLPGAVQTPTQPVPAPAPAPPAVADARAACETDIQQLCAGVQPGGRRILACLKQHKDQVSDVCKQAVVRATRGS